MDLSVYCFDLITKLAQDNPWQIFLVIGKDEWFLYHEQLENLSLNNMMLDHETLIRYINKSRFALMPTRQDS